MNHFNIRVYGILINLQQEVLLSNETYKGFSLTKFPGGGLEFGEGLLDCLKREWKEELDIDIQIKKHFYTTDFFQISAFDPESQVISIYYIVQADNEEIDFNKCNEHAYHWISMKNLSIQDVTMPIDKIVVSQLLNMI
jgi:8-oxo-dGTP diphosphatase